VNIHLPERLDQVDHRYRQVEDDGNYGQQEAYDGGARLKQHRRLAFPGEAPQFQLGRVVSG